MVLKDHRDLSIDHKGENIVYLEVPQSKGFILIIVGTPTRKGRLVVEVICEKMRVE